MNQIGKKMAASISAMLIVAGCSTTPTPSPGNLAAAQLAGTGVAAVWVVASNPTPAQEASMVDTLTMIQTYSSAVGTNGSYSAIVYPLVQAYVANSTSIRPQDKAMVLAGSQALLVGVDLMFQSNPTWNTDATTAGLYLNAFATGAKSALALPATDQKNVSAAKSYQAKLAIKK